MHAINLKSFEGKTFVDTRRDNQLLVYFFTIFLKRSNYTGLRNRSSLVIRVSRTSYRVLIIAFLLPFVWTILFPTVFLDKHACNMSFSLTRDLNQRAPKHISTWRKKKKKIPHRLINPYFARAMSTRSLITQDSSRIISVDYLPNGISKSYQFFSPAI